MENVNINGGCTEFCTYSISESIFFSVCILQFILTIQLTVMQFFASVEVLRKQKYFQKLFAMNLNLF